MRILKIIFITLFIIVALIVLVLGYFGFVPGLSHLFGSDKPRDLGIRYTQADYDSASQKNNVKIVTVSSAPNIESSIQWGGSHQVNNSFTSEEVTARINMNSANWAYFPAKDVQIKFNQDGSVEASGILLFDRLEGFAAATKVPQSDIQTVLQVFNEYKIPKIPIPVYMKGNLTIKDNNVDIAIPTLEIGRLILPRNVYAPAKSYFEDFVKQQLNSGGYGDLYVKSLDFDNGKLNFNGTLPDVATVAKNIVGL